MICNDSVSSFICLNNCKRKVYIILMPGLDINWFRAEKGYDPNIIRKSLERRFRDPKLVDKII